MFAYKFSLASMFLPCNGSYDISSNMYKLNNK